MTTGQRWITAVVLSMSGALPNVAAAQINPYSPPGPGWTIVQPCGQEAQWVPVDHPLAAQGICAPTPTTPSDAPARIEPGKVYRSRVYHIVIVVESIVTTETFNWTTLSTTTATVAQAITYQSESLYRLRQGGSPTVHDPTDVWQWFEISR